MKVDDLKAFREISKLAPFHLAACQRTLDKLKSACESTEPGSRRFIPDSVAAGGFNGIPIFVDEGVSYGQIEKRPGARPEERIEPPKESELKVLSQLACDIVSGA